MFFIRLDNSYKLFAIWFLKKIWRKWKYLLRTTLITCSILGIYSIFTVSIFIPLYSTLLLFQAQTIFPVVMEMETTLTTIKLMNLDLVRLARFDKTNFTWWKDKFKFLLTALKILYMFDLSLEPIFKVIDKVFAKVWAKRKKKIRGPIDLLWSHS